MTELELLLSGKASFSLEVPYRLYRTGSADKQPLFVYLHENGLNLTALQEKIKPLLALNGYHLLIQAPYPEARTENDERACYWIPDYKDEQTITAAREHVSEFLQEVIDGLLPHINAGRLLLIGWEGSRHQISYFCATRPHYINEIILFEGSVDRTWMDQDTARYKHLRMLGLSGKDAAITEETSKIIGRWLHGENEKTGSEPQNHS